LENGLAQYPLINVGGIKTACIDRTELVSVIVSQIDRATRQSTPMVILDTNGHAISLANSDADFMHCLNQADLVHADGQSVVSFSRWLKGADIPERTATTDTIHDIPNRSDARLKHFLLGGEAQVVDACAGIMTEKYPNFLIAGTHHGYFDKQNCDDIIEQINATQTDILWVGLGKPIEQYWIMQNKHKLRVPVIISCGGCFNYITGDYKRAPQWMQNWGVEWLHRMLSEPRKLFWRYLTTNPHAIYCVFKHKYFPSEVK
jgi:exopolysaccharide biosynthesis WecB/TagA/CpsF family protein